MSSLKRDFDQFSFQNQLVIIFIVGFASVLIFSTLGITWVANNEISNNFKQQGKALAETFIIQSTQPLLFESADVAQDRVKLIKGFPHVVEAAIYTQHCKLLYKKIDTQFFNTHNDHNCDFNDAKYRYDDSDVFLEYEDANYWQFSAPVFYQPQTRSSFGEEQIVDAPKEIIGYIRILLTKDGQYGINEIRGGIITSSIFIALMIGLVLFMGLQLMSRRMVKPMQSLSDTMHHAMNGALGMRVMPTGASELRQIASSFNSMLSVLEEREAELKIARDAAMESARIKSEFAANVSHEIRTPMHGIFGLLRLLRDMELNGEQREYVDLANESAEKLFDLINDILDFSKITEGRLELENTYVNIQEILENIIFEQASAKKMNKVETACLVDPSIPRDLEGDPTRIKQIFHNLVSNSIKFTEEGEVVLSATLIKDEGHFVLIRFCVRDTGIGISEQATSKIFDAYSQQDGSTSRKYGGTGLGLAISKKLIEAMQGSIKVNSEIGQGSEFIVEIPINRSLQNKPVEKSLPQWRGMRALLLAPVGLQLRILENLCEHQMLDHYWINRPEKLKQELTEKPTNYNILLINWPGDLENLLNELAELKNSKQLNVSIIRLIGRHEDDIPFNNVVDVTLRKPLTLKSIENALKDSLADKRWEAPNVYQYDIKPVAQKEQTTEHESLSDTSNEMADDMKKASLAINSKLKILVVEDNVTNQVVVTAALKKLGIVPDIAENGAEAIEAYKRCKYSLIIMDIQMPVMNGFDATKKIREMEGSGQHVTIIALTANVASSDANKCLECGMDDFLAKPFRLQHLESMLKIWLGDKFVASIEEEEAKESHT